MLYHAKPNSEYLTRKNLCVTIFVWYQPVMNAGHFLDYEITQLYHTNSTILNNCSLPSHRNFAHKFGEFVKLLKELKIMKCLLKVKIIHKLVFLYSYTFNCIFLSHKNLVLTEQCWGKKTESNPFECWMESIKWWRLDNHQQRASNTDG